MIYPIHKNSIKKIYICSIKTKKIKSRQVSLLYRKFIDNQKSKLHHFLQPISS